MKGDGVYLGPGLQRVIPSRDKSSCPHCGRHGYVVLPWTPPVGFDVLMEQLGCLSCDKVSYSAPRPRGF